MRSPLYRICVQHSLELPEDFSDVPKCPRGHLCKAWIIVDSDGLEIGRGYTKRAGVLASDLLGDHPGAVEEGEYAKARRSKPKTPCKYGHNKWTHSSVTKRWRCAECNKPKFRERRESNVG